MWTSRVRVPVAKPQPFDDLARSTLSVFPGARMATVGRLWLRHRHPPTGPREGR
jgi:hypothetical protein